MPAFCAYLGAGGIVHMYPGNVRHSPHLFSFFKIKAFSHIFLTKSAFCLALYHKISKRSIFFIKKQSDSYNKT